MAAAQAMASREIALSGRVNYCESWRIPFHDTFSDRFLRSSMLYFIAWVLFLLVVALAIPVASFLEKRKYAAANPQTVLEEDQVVSDEDAPSDSGEPDDGFGDDPAANFGDGEAVEFGEVEVTGGDDFSAFDEEFK